ncbi:S8 family serine peptidase [Pedobacter petrophilus]|uniref:S8 family serine peptidase n=1 Tax=Pedobacter petrophilus TaxID=1908241 RepID=A0A7K0FU85_9SPHI|nr:S8 family peptidase [Pedobacter petrophilus]MRX75145.1 S8 family serine peptidase [Pedobacter petrophilus]
MKVNTVFLIICLSVCVFRLNAQGQPGGVEKNIQKKFSAKSKKTYLQVNDVNLVQFDHQLTPAEIRKLRPKKRLAAGYFIADKANISAFSQRVIYQTEANGLWKASDGLAQLLNKSKTNDSLTVRLAVKNSLQQPEFFRQLKIKSIDQQNAIYTIYITADDLISLLSADEILYADIIPVAKQEVVINGLDLGLNQITNARNLFPGINGAGINISLKEEMYDITDLDLLGRTIPGAITTGAATSHATSMATLALGNGNSFIRGLGAAPNAKLAFSSFDNLMPDQPAALNRLQIRVQNHSYGTGIDNNYGIEAAAYDKQVFETDTLIHVFSAGNSGSLTPASGFYQGITARANLTGNFKQAKNLLVIGGINRENISENQSSKGPAYDGRVKPELVAIGEDGTSGSAAISSGAIALLEQFYLQKFAKAPSAALIRATLINSADDLGTPQVDYVFGYGKLNVAQSLKTLDENRVALYPATKGQDLTIPLTIPSNVAEVKLTITWNDPAAAVNAAQSLVNGLDLSLESPSGEIMLPWVLSNASNLDSIAQPATRKADLINNIQQISIENPVAGNFRVHVNGQRITQGSQQNFALAYRFKYKNTFSFITPGKDVYFFASEDNYIRWENTYPEKTGKLSVSYDEGLSWKVIDANVDLAKGFYNWGAPNLFSKAIVKMEVGTAIITSQSFTISSPRTLTVGYVCNDGLVLSWNPQVGAKDYTIYSIINNVLSPVSTVADTLVKLNLSNTASKYFAVAANGAGFSGLKSYTIDYTQQGVACYVRSLIASATADKIKLDLNIGTTLDIKNIIWEKQTGVNTYTVLQQTKPDNNVLDYTIFDDKPKPGIQFYRVTFETANGNVVSDLASATFLKENDFSFYPNPVTDYLTILSGSFEDYNLSIFNILGQKVFEEKATSSNRFGLMALATGVYVGVIVKSGAQVKKFKLIKN